MIIINLFFKSNLEFLIFYNSWHFLGLVLLSRCNLLPIYHIVIHLLLNFISHLREYPNLFLKLLKLVLLIFLPLLILLNLLISPSSGGGSFKQIGSPTARYYKVRLLNFLPDSISVVWRLAWNWGYISIKRFFFYSTFCFLIFIFSLTYALNSSWDNELKIC